MHEIPRSELPIGQRRDHQFENVKTWRFPSQTLGNFSLSISFRVLVPGMLQKPSLFLVMFVPAHSIALMRASGYTSWCCKTCTLFPQTSVQPWINFPLWIGLPQSPEKCSSFLQTKNTKLQTFLTEQRKQVWFRCSRRFSRPCNDITFLFTVRMIYRACLDLSFRVKMELKKIKNCLYVQEGMGFWFRHSQTFLSPLLSVYTVHYWDFCTLVSRLLDIYKIVTEDNVDTLFPFKLLTN